MNAGAVVPALSISKKVPTQVSESVCCRMKSAGDIGHETVLEPHFTSIVTAVEQAVYYIYSVPLKIYVIQTLTESVVAVE